MLKKTMNAVALSAGLFVAGGMAAHAASNCMPIGGLAMANFVPQADGTTTIVAPLMGSVASTSGRITAQKQTPTGLEMEMEHYFMTSSGGFMQTKDHAVLSPVQGKKDRYMLEITYHIQEKSTSGTLKGYKGIFHSFGLVDLAGLKGLVRYSGEICQ